MARKALSPGSDVGPYIIRETISQDNSGMTYLAERVDSPPDAEALVLRELYPEKLARRYGRGISASLRTYEAALTRTILAEGNRFRRYCEIDAPGLAKGVECLELNGTVYLISELPEGKSLLRTLNESGPLEPARARMVMRSVGENLSVLQAAGLVHGGMSPGSIFLTEDGGTVLAAPSCPDETDPRTVRVPHTADSSVYLAPEQIRDDYGHVSPATDAYGLAASMYHALTGTPPPLASERLSAEKAGRSDPLDLSRAQEVLAEDPALYEMLAAGLKTDIQDRAPSASQLESPMPQPRSEADLSDEEAAVGFQIAARDTGWRRQLRPLVAGGAVLLLLIIAIPLALQFSGKEIVHSESAPVASEPAPADDTDAQDMTGADVPAKVETASEDAGDVSEVSAEADEGPSPAMRDWMALDQDDPQAILAFISREDLEPATREQARVQWMALEQEAWRETRGRDEAAVVSFIEDYARPAPEFARFNETAERYLSELRREDEAAAEAEAASDETEASEPEANEAAPPEEGEGDTVPDTDAAEEDTGEEDAGEEEDASARDCETCPPMVAVPGADYSMAAHEVTVSEFRAYLSAIGASEPVGCFVPQTESERIWGYDSSASYAAPGYPVSGSHPAVCVGFSDAQAYANWLSETSGKSYRLPTEAEWSAVAGEVPASALACGGGNFADAALTSAGLQVQGQSCEDGSAFASVVAGSEAQISGLYGNVEEWVSDCVDGDCSRRYAMGGSWASVPGQIRSNLQAAYTSNSRTSTLGFRVVRED